MNNVHDLGGSHGFGPVPRKESGRLFDHEWEKKVFGLTFATLAQAVFNIDENRYARECMSPRDYLESRYYEQWFAALETNLRDKGVIALEELEERTRAFAAGTAELPPAPEMAELVESCHGAIFQGVPPARAVDREPRFSVGDRVRTRRTSTRGHTRLPRYARGRQAVVDAVRPAYVLPDSNAHGRGENPEHVYTLRFEGREL